VIVERSETVEVIPMTPYYQDKFCTIYHGDCRDILPTLDLVDLVLTDPPYGVKRDKGFGGFEGFGGFGKPIARKRFEDDDWDNDRPPAELLIAAASAGKLAIIWGGNFFADLLPRSTHWISWDKLQTMPDFGDCELAWTSSPRKSVTKVVIEWNGLLGKERGTRQHPTQKPLALMSWCVNKYSEPTDTVLDPFMGSGTTLRAAKDLGRKAIGIEIEEKYCEIAAKRLSQEVLNFG
jgi:DNA modification methylase